MSFANIGFVVQFFSERRFNQIFYEITSRLFDYYALIIPFGTILLIYYLLSERKNILNISNTKIQKRITVINLTIYFLIIFSYIFIFAFIVYFEHDILEMF